MHGLNLSLGYAFDPEWFAAGQSPLCNEVDRLVRCGVAVVVAAGNGGYGTVISSQGDAEAASHGGTIADPGNADLAITVGSTHRTSPHAFGVSYSRLKAELRTGAWSPTSSRLASGLSPAPSWTRTSRNSRDMRLSEGFGN